MYCAIWYYFYNLKEVKNTHRGVLLLVKLQASVHNFAKNNNLPCAFSTFFKLYKWYQIAQRITNVFSKTQAQLLTLLGFVRFLLRCFAFLSYRKKRKREARTHSISEEKERFLYQQKSIKKEIQIRFLKVTRQSSNIFFCSCVLI